MAVWVYKGEKSALIKPKSLQAHLDAGWSVEQDKPKRRTKKSTEAEQE